MDAKFVLAAGVKHDLAKLAAVPGLVLVEVFSNKREMSPLRDANELEIFTIG